MNRIRFRYEVITELRLSKAEVEALTVLCEGHYDGAVRALSTPGHGAILNGARNHLTDPSATEEEKQFSTIRVTWHQLDILCKATESVRSPFVSRDGDPTIHEQLRQLLREASAEWERQNPELCVVSKG